MFFFSEFDRGTATPTRLNAFAAPGATSADGATASGVRCGTARGAGSSKKEIFPWRLAGTKSLRIRIAKGSTTKLW